MSALLLGKPSRSCIRCTAEMPSDNILLHESRFMAGEVIAMSDISLGPGNTKHRARLVCCLVDKCCQHRILLHPCSLLNLIAISEHLTQPTTLYDDAGQPAWQSAASDDRCKQCKSRQYFSLLTSAQKLCSTQAACRLPFLARRVVVAAHPLKDACKRIDQES